MNRQINVDGNSGRCYKGRGMPFSVGLEPRQADQRELCWGRDSGTEI